MRTVRDAWNKCNSNDKTQNNSASLQDLSIGLEHDVYFNNHSQRSFETQRLCTHGTENISHVLLGGPTAERALQLE